MSYEVILQYIFHLILWSGSLQELHQSLSQRGDSRLPLTRDQASQLGESEFSMSSLPQREITIIGGDHQQQVQKYTNNFQLLKLICVSISNFGFLLIL